MNRRRSARRLWTSSCSIRVIAGVLAGIGTTKLIGVFAGWQTLIGVPSLGVALSVALGVGLFFGYYPARRAAQLDPIAAPRYE
jgi:putative ABC transport system permease protein